MGVLYRALWMGLALVLSLGCQAKEPATPLRVVSYNVQFLPEIVSSRDKRKEPEYRAAKIAEEMAAFDIVALQETFHPRFREIILDGLRDAWDGELNVLISPEAEGFYITGGCLIATRLPIAESGSMVFTQFSTPAEYGFRADGYAAKGVIHARLKTPGGEVDVFATHLEARADQLRPAQYKEMAAFIARQRGKNLPGLLMGDLNTNGLPELRAEGGSQYNTLMATLREALPEVAVTDTWPHLMGDAHGGTSKQESTEIGKRIDYIILFNPKTGPSLDAQKIWVNLYQDPKIVALSDHNAVEAELTLNKGKN